MDFHCFHNWLEGSDWAKTWQQAITFINKQGNGCDTKNGMYEIGTYLLCGSNCTHFVIDIIFTVTFD